MVIPLVRKTPHTQRTSRKCSKSTVSPLSIVHGLLVVAHGQLRGGFTVNYFKFDQNNKTRVKKSFTKSSKIGTKKDP